MPNMLTATLLCVAAQSCAFADPAPPIDQVRQGRRNAGSLRCAQALGLRTAIWRRGLPTNIGIFFCFPPHFLMFIIPFSICTRMYAPTRMLLEHLYSLRPMSVGFWCRLRPCVRRWDKKFSQRIETHNRIWCILTCALPHSFAWPRPHYYHIMIEHSAPMFTPGDVISTTHPQPTTWPAVSQSKRNQLRSTVDEFTAQENNMNKNVNAVIMCSCVQCTVTSIKKLHVHHLQQLRWISSQNELRPDPGSRSKATKKKKNKLKIIKMKSAASKSAGNQAAKVVGLSLHDFTSFPDFVHTVRCLVNDLLLPRPRAAKLPETHAILPMPSVFRWEAYKG